MARYLHFQQRAVKVLYYRSPALGMLWQAALVLSVVCWATGGRATTFVVASINQLAAASDAIVLGQVTDIQGHESAGHLETLVTLAIERSLRGAGSDTLTLVQDGGAVGNVHRWTFGAPTFFVGERVLVFARRDSSGALATTFLGMGKFRVVRSSDGSEFALRNLDESTVLSSGSGQTDPVAGRSRFRLGELIRQIEGAPRSTRSVEVTHVSRRSETGHWQTNFTFTGPPGLRWFVPEGQPLTYMIGSDGDQTLGSTASIAAAESALNAWSSPTCTNLQLINGGAAENAPFSACDHRSQVLFNDPSNEIADGIDCVGVLAVGGICGDGTTTQVFNGSRFYPITEGDVVVNNSYGGCEFWNATNLAEIITHEVGHTLGFAHSSDDPNEADLILRNATMYYAAHFDGRGAALRTDDVAAMCDLYPSGASGSVSVRQFALLFNASGRTGADRIVIDGQLDFAERRFSPASDPLIVNVRAGSVALARLDIRPGTWDLNPEATRYRTRGSFANGRLVLTLSSATGGMLRFHLGGRGLDLSAAKMDGVTISFTTDGASASTSVELRTRSRSRVFP